MFARLVALLSPALAGVSLVCLASPYTFAEAPVRPVVVGYFAEWNNAYRAADIPADVVTHVLYSFARVEHGVIALSKPKPSDASGVHPSVKHFAELRDLKARHPNVRTLISIGGWGASHDFAAVAADDASRQTFARSCAAFANANGFDGIDIDWEFPSDGGDHPESANPAEAHQFTLLLAALREQLDAQATRDGHPYLLTIAAPAGPAHYEVLELSEIQKSVDLINVMTYDLNGGWSAKTDFNAALYAPQPVGGFSPNGPLSVDATVQAYLKAGVPKEKIVVGVPFYGCAFGGVGSENDGLFQPHDKSEPKPVDGGEWTYQTIHAQHLDAPDRRHWDDVAKVPWLYDPATHVMISYDDAESLRNKGQYVRDQGLGGVMIWELSQDDAQSSLLNALVGGLNGSK